MNRWRGSGASLVRAMAAPNLKRKASNTFSAVQDTFLSTKDIYERHKVVFTMATSVGSILTAWAGYSLRQIHQAKIDKRLGSIEKAFFDSIL
ncbi:hypothetical protein QJS04_geneDACA008057 [Acorus gramineus]|uniref:Uncharacterized protein n=1 Tax=Acorus gramineus TaxID=55184 RepID=A0AAV9BCA5_ACOGR|nr:hypothetical protein QJS04_geneDACA008057 [Acorus gramineus]